MSDKTYSAKELRKHIRITLKMALGSGSIGIDRRWYDEMTDTVIEAVERKTMSDPYTDPRTRVLP